MRRQQHSHAPLKKNLKRKKNYRQICQSFLKTVDLTCLETFIIYQFS